MTIMRLLLLSNSTNHGQDYLSHARGVIGDHLDGVDSLIFVPYAMHDHDAYTEKARNAFATWGVSVTGLHTAEDPAAAVQTAQAIFVGGGNTFRLVRRLRQDNLLTVIQDAVRSGVRYLAASAGSNIAAPTLSTTNDMPIVEPGGFGTLGLIPFQLNCHYLDADPESTHAGETRELRLQEYLEENQGPVLALREGTYLRVTSDHDQLVAEIGGTAVSRRAPGPARLFSRDETREISGDVSSLFG
jgi:dipeptidase E